MLNTRLSRKFRILVNIEAEVVVVNAVVIDVVGSCVVVV